MDGTGQTRKKLEKLGMKAGAWLAWLTKTSIRMRPFSCLFMLHLKLSSFFCSGESAKEKPTVGRSRTWVY
jgi:hypothetical protein